MNIKINNSSFLGLIFYLLHGLAIFSVVISRLYWLITILLLAIIVLSLLRQTRLHSTREHPGSIRQIKLGNKNWLKVKKTGSPDWISTEVESMTLWPRILMLKLKEISPTARTLNLLVMDDAVSREEFRQICAWANQVKFGEGQ